MKIVWDEQKRLRNLEKHGFDFTDLTLDFFAAAIVRDARLGRFLAIGELGGNLVIVVVFRPLGSEAISVISMRRANAKERSRS